MVLVVACGRQRGGLDPGADRGEHGHPDDGGERHDHRALRSERDRRQRQRADAQHEQVLPEREDDAGVDHPEPHDPQQVAAQLRGEVDDDEQGPDVGRHVQPWHPGQPSTRHQSLPRHRCERELRNDVRRARHEDDRQAESHPVGVRSRPHQDRDLDEREHEGRQAQDRSPLRGHRVGVRRRLRFQCSPSTRCMRGVGVAVDLCGVTRRCRSPEHRHDVADVGKGRGVAIGVVTDSTTDLPLAMAEDLGIRIVPMSVAFDDRSYLSRAGDLRRGVLRASGDVVGAADDVAAGAGVVRGGVRRLCGRRTRRRGLRARVLEALRHGAGRPTGGGPRRPAGGGGGQSAGRRWGRPPRPRRAAPGGCRRFAGGRAGRDRRDAAGTVEHRGRRHARVPAAGRTGHRHAGLRGQHDAGQAAAPGRRWPDRADRPGEDDAARNRLPGAPHPGRGRGRPTGRGRDPCPGAGARRAGGAGAA